MTVCESNAEASSARSRVRSSHYQSYDSLMNKHGQADHLHLICIYTLFSILYPLGFDPCTIWWICWCWRMILVVSPEHKVMASAIARVWAVCVLGIPPLEEPVPDSVSDFLVTKTWRVVRVPSILSLALAMSKTWVDEQTILPWCRETPHGIKHLVPEPLQKLELVAITEGMVRPTLWPKTLGISCSRGHTLLKLPHVIGSVQNKSWGSDGWQHILGEKARGFVHVWGARPRQASSRTLQSHNTIEKGSHFPAARNINSVKKHSSIS